ncbi:MAG: GntR family transcriptional regulator [Victivallaceae bacterium]|nr:GntR family transcriptional regulator [Victivallaceae bacterium]
MVTATTKKRIMKYDQLIPVLLREVESRKLKNGDKFFSERELVKEFNIGRNTAVETLKILESHGVVERIQGKGTFFTGKTGINEKDKSRSSRTGNIAVVMASRFESEHISGMLFLREIEREVRKINHSMLLTLLDDAGIHSQIENLLCMNKADGYLLWSVSGDVQNCFVNHQVPALVLGQSLFRELPSLAPDHFNLTYEAVNCLLKLQHRHIGIMSRNRMNIGVLMGVKGYEAAHRSAGLSIDDDLIELDAESPKDILKKVDKLLDAGVTGIVFDGIDIYDSAKIEIAKRKLRIPQDLSVIFTEIPSEFSSKYPDFGGFEFDRSLMCETAVRMIMDMINGKNVKSEILPFAFKSGKSCAKPR